MAAEQNGELVPVGGGDNIPLIKHHLVIGRRESCDVPLRFEKVSGRHCELSYQDGYWLIRDLGSTNGVKVNGQRVREKALRPGDEISIADRRFTILYEGAGTNSMLELMEDNIMDQPLLEKAGLVRPERDKKRRPGQPAQPEPEEEIDISDLL